MSIDAPARCYAKGAAKRREILDAALELMLGTARRTQP